jgi:hypothetical protein
MLDIAFKSEMTPIVIAHISGGVIGVLAGLIALFSRKGAIVHRTAGTVFFISMMIGATSATYLAYTKAEYPNMIAGALTLYLLLTAWVTARRAENKAGLFELGAFLFAAAGAAIGTFFTYLAVQQGTAILGGIPGFIFSGVVAFCALLDLTVIARRGLAGRQRIARHLWRMHLAFFVAAGSFFPGQLHLFPDYIREIKPIIVLFLPAFSIFALMFFWLVRVLFTGWWKTQPDVGAKS